MRRTFLEEAVMAKPELGAKRTCVSCGARFYDLARVPAMCPKCGTEQPAEQPRLKRAAAVVDEKLKKRAGAAAETDTDEVELADVDADDPALAEEEIEDEDDAIEAEIEVEGERDEET
jgi:uncharacterized protein (TIGR02300 family)